MVGKVLKELYVDSALKRGENIDKESEEDKPVVSDGKNISWKEFKNVHLNA